jgi:hypothetical protein
MGGSVNSDEITEMLEFSGQGMVGGREGVNWDIP